MSATEQAIEKAADNAVTLSDLIVQAGLAIKEMAEQHGDKAVDLTLFAARIDAGSRVLTTVSLLICSVLLAYFAYRVWNWGNKEENKWFNKWEDKSEVRESVWWVVVPSGVFSCLFLVGATASFSLSSIIGVFIPEYWLLIKATGFF